MRNYCEYCDCPLDTAEEHEIGVCVECMAEEDGEDEHDGQPDEMQEWHDFDPDC